MGIIARYNNSKVSQQQDLIQNNLHQFRLGPQAVGCDKTYTHGKPNTGQEGREDGHRWRVLGTYLHHTGLTGCHTLQELGDGPLHDLLQHHTPHPIHLYHPHHHHNRSSQAGRLRGTVTAILPRQPLARWESTYNGVRDRQPMRLLHGNLHMQLTCQCQGVVILCPHTRPEHPRQLPTACKCPYVSISPIPPS